MKEAILIIAAALTIGVGAIAGNEAEANKEGGKASCEQITENQYMKERA